VPFYLKKSRTAEASGTVVGGFITEKLKELEQDTP
jgi:hypothetical protein